MKWSNIFTLMIIIGIFVTLGIATINRYNDDMNRINKCKEMFGEEAYTYESFFPNKEYISCKHYEEIEEGIFEEKIQVIKNE